MLAQQQETNRPSVVWLWENKGHAVHKDYRTKWKISKLWMAWQLSLYQEHTLQVSEGWLGVVPSLERKETRERSCNQQYLKEKKKHTFKLLIIDLTLSLLSILLLLWQMQTKTTAKISNSRSEISIESEWHKERPWCQALIRTLTKELRKKSKLPYPFKVEIYFLSTCLIPNILNLG